MKQMDTASLSSSQNQSLLSDAINPKERSAYHLDRARRLIFIGFHSVLNSIIITSHDHFIISLGSSTSLELERALIETSKAISFIADESKYYMFMAKLYKLGLDVSSAIFCYRYALKLDPNNDMAAKFLCEMLLLRGNTHF